MNFKNTKLLFLFSLSPVILFAQDFDESFLKSLPQEIREDVIENQLKKNQVEELEYRRPSTLIKKPEVESDRYGASIFSMMQSSFMPLNEANFDPSYILDFGDTLEVQLVGKKSSINKLPIKRDGSINLADIGKIFVSGLSLDNASTLIKKKVGNAFVGIDVYVSLVSIRDIQIIIAGNVYNPGTYTLNGNSNVFHALSSSGGPSDEGSFREIDLIRNNEVIESIDLYQIFIYGQSNFNERLRSGDVIFVRPANDLVSIEGAVNRPGKYELLDDENLSKLLFFSNGVTSAADFSEINLIRILDGQINKITISDIAELSNMESRDADKISIRKFPFRSVSIEGAVKNPGSYLINEGDGILNLVERAGGYTNNAYPLGGILQNKATQEINEIAKRKLYEDFINDLLNQPSAFNDESSGSIALFQELKDIEVGGRVSAEFDLAKLRNDEDLDILLQEGDKILIPEYLDQVYVFGEVSSEGTTRYSEGKDAKYYISTKGGFTSSASKNEIYVLYPNGETLVIGTKNIFKTNKVQVEILPGSIIYIPRKINNFGTFQTAQAYATIIGNLGVSLASFAVLKD